MIFISTYFTTVKNKVNSDCIEGESVTQEDIAKVDAEIIQEKSFLKKMMMK